MIRQFIRFSYSLTIEPFIEANSYKRLEQLQQIRKNNSLIPYIGMFNEYGSKNFIKRDPNINYKTLLHNNFLQISPIGIGTYRGNCTQIDDLLMFNAIIDSVNFGCNVIDTCSNFRKGRSQKIVGYALSYLIQNNGYFRNQLLIATKAGYITKDMEKQYEDIDIINQHCVEIPFLEKRLEISLKNIGINTLDIFYLNNFAECQLQILGWQNFQKKLCKIFEWMQQKRKEQKINFYGLCSWQSFRINSKNKNYLSLEKIVSIAQKIGGKNHGFKYVQTPINIMMPEVFAERNQNGVSLLQVAQNLSINVISCSPILSGTLINVPLPSDSLKCRNNGAKHLQLIRCIPSSALICTLIGQKQNRHVSKNLQVLTTDKLNQNEWKAVFVPQKQVKNIPEE